MGSKALPSPILWLFWIRQYITGQCIREKALMGSLHQEVFKKFEDVIWTKKKRQEGNSKSFHFGGKNNSVSSIYWVPMYECMYKCFVTLLLTFIKILQSRYYPCFYTGANYPSKNFGYVFKLTQVINNRARIWTQVSDSKACTFPF